MRKAVSAALTILIILSACGSGKNKKREELSSAGELFQNTTAKFNGYFNARELWDLSVSELDASYQYNYNQLLPVFPYSENDGYLNYKEEMDKTIEKLATVISKHPASDWVDDSYLLMAKALFVKRDYENAINTLEYLTTKYSPGYLEKVENNRIKPEKKKKKDRWKKLGKEEDQGPKVTRYVPGNQYDVYDGRIVDKLPAFYEALIWIAHTYTLSENYIFAELALDRFEKYDLPMRIKRLEYPVRALWNIKRQNYSEASNNLKDAIDSSVDHYEKARYAFIRGQIAINKKDYTTARKAFEDCIGFNPRYEMVFAAQIKEIEIQALSGDDGEKVQKSLERMLEDGKNTEYFDKIYFAMARLAMENNRLADAEEFFQKAIQNSTGDEGQLAESYYQLAEMNYNRKDYLDAKYYFDSTLMFMNKSDDRYFYVESNSSNLEDIAKNLEIIQLNDSLLRLTNLTDKERRDFAYALEQRKQDEKTKGSGSVSDRFKNKFTPQRAASSSRPGGPSSFFAYDEKRLKKGQRDFEKVWGQIELQDFWRLSSLRDNSLENPTDIEQYEALVLTDEDVDRILDFIPSTPEEIAQANSNISEAMYQLGVLYRDQLEQYEKSIETHESLISKYPDNVRMLEAMFYLYLSYNDLLNRPKANEYKKRIIDNYPNTNYAKALENPEFINVALNKEQLVKNYYDEVYQNFQNSDYQLAYDKIQSKDAKFEMSTTYASKFALLNAMCIGHLQGKGQYIRSLRLVIGKYKGTPESKRAKEILDLLGLYEDKTKTSETNENEEQTSIDTTQLVENNFEYNPNILHYVVISYNGKALNQQKAKIALSNFNNKYFRLERLKVSSISLDTSGDKPILVVRKFKDAQKAEEYTSTLIEKNQEVLGGQAFRPYPMSQINYRELIRVKSIETYAKFYQENYVQ